MNDSAPLGRFVKTSRDFGLIIAMKVAYSKVLGRLRPAVALADGPIYKAGRREVSILLSTAEQGAATFDAVVEFLARRCELGWEVCVCERSPTQPDMARALARSRGTQPWIRIVTADESVDDATAARWMVEQSTGQFVALVAPGYTPGADAMARLLAWLHNDPGIDAAVLVGTDEGFGCHPSRVESACSRLLLLRKSGYLRAIPGRWPLNAHALAKVLNEAGVPTAYMTERET